MSDTPIADSLENSLEAVKTARLKMNAQYGKVSPAETLANRDEYEAALAIHMAYEDSDSIHTVEESVPLAESDAPKWFTIGRRKWLYNVAIAGLVILAGVQAGIAVSFDSWASLVAAILNLGLVAAPATARANLAGK